jgi:hypothetical protein
MCRNGFYPGAGREGLRARSSPPGRWSMWNPFLGPPQGGHHGDTHDEAFRIETPGVSGFRLRAKRYGETSTKLEERSRGGGGQPDLSDAISRPGVAAEPSGERRPRVYKAALTESSSVGTSVSSCSTGCVGRKPGNLTRGRRSSLVVGLRNSRKSGRQSCVARKFMNRL